MIKNTPITNNLNKAPVKKRRLSEIVRDQIIADMLSANLQPGDSYATEDELTQRFSVSRNTIRKAMAELESAGFIVRRQRVGAIATQKSCTGRISLPSSQKNSITSTQAFKVILVLPRWEAVTGNYFSNIVLRELSNVKDGQQKIIVEIRLFDDPLENLGEDIKAILIVDPIQQIIPSLAHWSQKGIKVIAIEPRNLLYMAVNIRCDIYQAAYDSVKLLYQQGHRHIGLVNQDVSHNTFQQWLLGYIAAHQGLNLAILPHAILQIENGHENKLGKINDISAWICSYRGGLELIAQACHKQGLKIPDDIAVIGADDPGDVIVASIGCSLTVTRPDYLSLSQTIRQILDEKITALPGSIIDNPMKWIYRDSTTIKN